ncbi:MAG TPA: hypothetical protein PLB37_00265 [Sphaerochaeta sp.]|nr:hypothetical protein [Sphaerochaeta sp.]
MKRLAAMIARVLSAFPPRASCSIGAMGAIGEGFHLVLGPGEALFMQQWRYAGGALPL